jgi:hypothetical protein
MHDYQNGGAIFAGWAKKKGRVVETTESTVLARRLLANGGPPNGRS